MNKKYNIRNTSNDENYSTRNTTTTTTTKSNNNNDNNNTAGFPKSDTSGLVQYFGYRRYFFVPRPVLKIFGHSAHRF